MNTIKKPILALILLAAAPGASAQDASSPSSPTRIRYIVRDMPASVTFYTGLGLQVEIQSGPYFAALSRGGVQLLLSPTSGPGGASQPMPNGDKPAPGGWNRLVLDTQDLQGDVERVRKQGVHFRNDITVGLGGNQVLLEDPSGNVVELFQPTIVYPKR